MQEITTKELKELVHTKAKFILLDCRSFEYYDTEHISGAINLRWKNVPEQAEKLLPDKNVLIVTYCGGITCDASIKCFQNLKQLGYTNLREYSGGLAEWKVSGYSTVKGITV